MTSKAEYEASIAEKDQQIAALRHELNELKRLLFGSKSEKQTTVSLDPKQLDLGFDPSEATALDQLEQEVISYKRKKKKAHPGRTALPDHIPTEEVIIEPANLSEDMELIGEEVTEVLDYKPGVLLKRRYIRRRYALRSSASENKDQAEIVIAPMPSRPIQKGIPEPGLLAHIMVAKYVDHLPFYRQIKQFERNHGWIIHKSTINDWFAATCSLLKPLYELLKKRVIESDYLQADESTIKVLERPKKTKSTSRKSDKKIHLGYQWVFRNALNGLVLFSYRKGRGANGIMELLSDFSGYLQSDGYSAYKTYLSKHPDVRGVSCLAHIRRKFFEAKDNDPVNAQLALDIIGYLYLIEAHCRDRKRSSEDRLAVRQRLSLPVYRALTDWVEYQHKNNLSSGAIGKAYYYANNELPKLVACFEDGRLELDNNLIENSIRPLALGRKNYLFAGSQKGAERAAMMYSFFASCKKLDVNPWEWLKDILTRIADHPINRLEELLPHKWKAEESEE